MKSLPKSLHTVTVLVNVARIMLGTDQADTREQAINIALRSLGYGDAEDPYGLREKALKQMGA